MAYIVAYIPSTLTADTPPATNQYACGPAWRYELPIEEAEPEGAVLSFPHPGESV